MEKELKNQLINQQIYIEKNYFNVVIHVCQMNSPDYMSSGGEGEKIIIIYWMPTVCQAYIHNTFNSYNYMELIVLIINTLIITFNY